LQAAAVSGDDSIKIRTLPPLFTKGGEPEMYGERYKQSLTENIGDESNVSQIQNFEKENTYKERRNWAIEK
jgi:hypothetical protein